MEIIEENKNIQQKYIELNENSFIVSSEINAIHSVVLHFISLWPIFI